MNFLKGFLVAVTAFLLQSCFNSDDHLFDASQAVDIKVETTLSNSMTDYSKIVKADTFKTYKEQSLPYWRTGCR